MLSSADVGKIKDKIEKEDGFKGILQLENLKMNVLKQTSFFKWSIFLAGAILSMISLSMLGSFSKLSVLERKKEIAIIKSIGASNTEVLLTLWFDSACISVISIFAAAAFTGILSAMIPRVIPELAFAESGFLWLTLLTFAMLFFIAILFYTFFGMSRLIKTMPAQLMRDG
jgi:ABC-type antimicrobial peptide transport system permease subunit